MFNIVNLTDPVVIIDLILAVLTAILCVVLLCRKINRIFVYTFYSISLSSLILSSIFELKILNIILALAIIIASIIFVTVNQSEFRYLVLRNTTLKSKKEKIQQASTQDMYKMVAETVRSFSRTKTGALITFEKTTPLDNVIKNGTLVNAPVSPELLMTIFYPGTRLHDGAVVIRGNMILAASVYYTPTSRALTGKFGSRHRAAVGISEVSDSVTVVVSEETGRISLAYKAKIESTTYDNFLDDLIDLMNDKD